MTLNFFADKPKDDNGKRYRAINVVRTFLWGRPHLPKDLISALHFLLPDLDNKQSREDDWEY